MKEALASIGVALAMSLTASAQSTWVVDNAHSRVKFSVSHLIIAEVEGNFRVYSGTVRTAGNDLTGGVVDFTVDVNSINTDNEMRDKHLKSDDFFNAEKYPQMGFKSVSWKKVDDKNYVLEGDLTIRDVTKRVALNVLYAGTTKDVYGNVKAGFKATTVINRFDFGLKWNTLTEGGGAVVGANVNVTVILELGKKQS